MLLYDIILNYTIGGVSSKRKKKERGELFYSGFLHLKKCKRTFKWLCMHADCNTRITTAPFKAFFWLNCELDINAILNFKTDYFNRSFSTKHFYKMKYHTIFFLGECCELGIVSLHGGLLEITFTVNLSFYLLPPFPPFPLQLLFLFSSTRSLPHIR